MTPTYAYLRVSGPDQLDGDGFMRQETNIRKFSAHTSHSIAQVFQEQVKGTTDSMDRPVWVDMLAAILAGDVKTIIIERLDRLARDLMVQEHIIADLRKRGITLISAAEPDLCHDDPSRKLMRQVMGAFAEYDRAMIVAKTYAARKRIRDRGERCEGTKPFGFYPHEQPIVSQILELHASGLNTPAIVAHLNHRGVRTKRGGVWYDMSVSRVLKRGQLLP